MINITIREYQDQKKLKNIVDYVVLAKKKDESYQILSSLQKEEDVLHHLYPFLNYLNETISIKC